MKGHEMELGDFVTLEIDRNHQTSTTLMGEVVGMAESLFNADRVRIQIRHLHEWIELDDNVAVVSVIKGETGLNLLQAVDNV